MNKAKCLAVIPARFGSKRIPNKNLLEYNKIPMFAHAVLKAKDSKIFDKIVVSTDSEIIANLARNFDAEVPKLRSEHLADDFATTNDVMEDVLDKSWLGDFLPDYVCCIYPVTPLLRVEHISEGFRHISKKKYDYVFPVSKYSHPIQRGFLLNNTKAPIMLNPENLLVRTQDFPETYHDSGQYYWGTFEAWAEKRPIIGSGSFALEHSPYEFIDIDNKEDLNVAIKLAEKYI